MKNERIIFDPKNLERQVMLLEDWNIENVKSEPEQVRKNIETLGDIYMQINAQYC